MPTDPETELITIKEICLEGESPEDHAVHADALGTAYATFAASEMSFLAASGIVQLTANVEVDAGLAP